jgi:AraC-like DNA-binding protein
MDVLDDILSTLDLRGALYFRTDFTGPWAVQVPELALAARFHLVVQGRAHFSFASGDAVTLGPGDLVLIPRGRAHVIADEPGRPAPPLETVLAAAGYTGEGVLTVGGGDRGAATQMICGHLTFRHGADHPLLRALPEYLLIDNALRAREPWLDETLRLIARRMFSDAPGSAAAVTRLSEIVLIELLRVGIGVTDTLRGVLSALSDRQIGRALELMHKSPEMPWTVEGLASEVGMSRSRFAERFGEALGMGPMAYLSEWRLQTALALLEDGRRSVQQVAHASGYRSPAAFSRAFGAKFGVAPTQWRRAG